MRNQFEQMQRLLAVREWELSASELHGSLCGFLSARGELRGLEWLDVAVAEPVSSHLEPSEQAFLAELAQTTAVGLEQGELGFHPVLPEDDQPLGERVAALSQWCDGFVGGLGLGGLTEDHGLSETAREAVEDLARIARTELTLDDDDEGDEAAFVEVLEFVRIGAVLIYEELRASQLLRRTSRQDSHGRDRPH